jgi:caa(3)-type oxidase subunit IV
MDHSHEPAKAPLDLHTPDPAVVKEVMGNVKTYIMVGIGLFVGTVITVWFAGIDFGGHSRNVTVGLLIATAKATAVALIFMHLSHERSTIYKFLLFTVIFFAGMLFLFVLHHFDPIHYSSWPHAGR